jgi:hypothetical protein
VLFPHPKSGQRVRTFNHKAILAAYFFLGFALGCQKLPLSQLDQAGEPKSSPEKDFGEESIGSKTTNGILESKFNKIERGMTEEEVETILGRKADQSLLQGGSLGDIWSWWLEDSATIFVDFDLYGKAQRKTITPTNHKQGPVDIIIKPNFVPGYTMPTTKLVER